MRLGSEQIQSGCAREAWSEDVMKTCLVVDDSSVIRKVARRILEGLDFQITEAEDGERRRVVGSPSRVKRAKSESMSIAFAAADRAVAADKPIRVMVVDDSVV